MLLYSSGRSGAFVLLRVVGGFCTSRGGRGLLYFSRR